MHYGVYAFSKNDKKTMESNDPNLEQIAGHVYLKIPSFSDIKVINMMYECGKNCQNVACPPEGFVNKECKCVTPRSYHDDTCVDNPIHIDNCGAWKERGECENMSDWMFVNCRRTCNKCSRFGLK
ncbi:zinc metalloproteinase nas-34-like [Tubulanus polymorphus]|uniref:zinc metalloproteinase nas-34-like n=1 Tax=Tubulanus polymorphus TaxID=672921 RepID=UPI003DA64D69